MTTPKQDLIERVRNAIRAEYDRTHGEDMTMRQARAAALVMLEAMREPSEEAVFLGSRKDYEDCDSKTVAEAIWTAMLDAFAKENGLE